MKSGVDLIQEERERQINIEGYNPLTDAEFYANGQLAGAAMCYLSESINKFYGKEVARAQVCDERSKSTHVISDADAVWEDAWPFEFGDNDKREKHDRMRCLVIAGALIAAELDALQYNNKAE